MERAAAWGITLDTSNPDEIVASFRGATIRMPVDPDEPDLPKFKTILEAMQRGVMERPDPPTDQEKRRYEWLRMTYKIVAYRKRIREITAQIAAYPRPVDVPQPLRSERLALIAKATRFPALRDAVDINLDDA